MATMSARVALRVVSRFEACWVMTELPSRW
jgi:hypothetical protein